jgi:hypothetical protein
MLAEEAAQERKPRKGKRQKRKTEAQKAGR